MEKPRYDNRGKPIGRTREKLADQLETALTAHLGTPITVQRRDMRNTADDAYKWCAFFWREMEWGGYRAMIRSEATMTECLARGFAITEWDPPYGGTDRQYHIVPNP